MKLADKLLQKLKQKKLTLSCAESCSGGLLADAFVSVSGASEVFLGSLVCYAPAVKQDVLKVEKSIVRRRVVSEECAVSMAEKSLELFNSDTALSITGYAEKSDDANIPDGTIYIAASCKKFTVCEKITAKKSRNENRKFAVMAALRLLDKLLESKI